MKFKKILQKSLGYSLNESPIGMIKDSGYFDAKTKEEEEAAFEEYINKLREKYGDNIINKLKYDKKNLSDFVKSKETEEQANEATYQINLKEHWTSLENYPKEKSERLLELIKDFIQQNYEKVQRAISGNRFEKSFKKKYGNNVIEIKKLKRPSTGKFNMGHSNLTIKFKNTDSSHPPIWNFQNIDVSNLEFDVNPREFRLAKGDFFTTESILKTKDGEIEKKVKENNNGHIFELKKYSSDKINAGVNILFSESKKVASRDYFIEYFGTQRHKEHWNLIKEKYKDDPGQMNMEKTKAWPLIARNIAGKSQENISSHNEVIEFLSNEAKKFIKNNTNAIIKGIETDLAKRKWWFVAGEEGNFIFNEINIRSFVNNINLDTTSWQGIKRVRITINKDVFEVEKGNNIKEEIINISERIGGYSFPNVSTLPTIKDIFQADYEALYELNATIEIEIPRG